MIRVELCSKSYEGVPVLKDVSCTVNPGEIYGIIGPNGSGKSTLLRLVSGVERASSGSVRIEGRPVESYPRRRLAQMMAVLEQETIPAVGFTVRQVVEMGRFPHQDWLGRDRGAAGGAHRPGGSGHEPAHGVDLLLDQVMDRLGLSALAERTLDQVSGGERQRTALGKAMAQEPRILLLDEPTTYLDIGYQLQMMDYVSRWNRECGLTVVAVLHDLNLAAQYCHRLLVLHNGRIEAEGTPGEIITPELIGRVYGTVPAVVPHPVSGIPQILLQPGEV